MNLKIIANSRTKISTDFIDLNIFGYRLTKIENCQTANKDNDALYKNIGLYL